MDQHFRYVMRFFHEIRSGHFVEFGRVNELILDEVFRLQESLTINQLGFSAASLIPLQRLLNSPIPPTAIYDQLENHVFYLNYLFLKKLGYLANLLTHVA